MVIPSCSGVYDWREKCRRGDQTHQGVVFDDRERQDECLAALGCFEAGTWQGRKNAIEVENHEEVTTH